MQKIDTYQREFKLNNIIEEDDGEEVEDDQLKPDSELDDLIQEPGLDHFQFQVE